MGWCILRTPRAGEAASPSSAGVAQLVEHLFCKQVVAGSSPIVSSWFSKKPVRFGGLPEWPKGADCKSAGVSLRWFEPTTLHRVKRREGCGSSSVGRASVFQTECRRFEPGLPLRPERVTTLYGSRPGSSVVEHLLGKEEVVSSNLILGSKSSPNHDRVRSRRRRGSVSDG